MTNTEKYNGWANWHTWNAFNWLDSYESTQTICHALATDGGDDAIRDFFIDCYWHDHDGIDTNMVDWQEITEAFI